MGNQTYGYLVAFAAAIGGLLFGYEIGVVSQTLSMISFGLKFDLLVLLPVRQFANGTYVTDGSVPDTLKPFAESVCTKFNETYSTCDSAGAAGNTGLVTFTFLIGCAFGAILVSILADLWGRKKCIIIAGMFFLAGGAFQTFADGFAALYFGRVVSGIAIGVLSMAAPCRGCR